MHWLDRVARLTARRTPLPKKPFFQGWGDEDLVQWYLDNAGTVPPVEDIEPRLRPARRSGRIVMRDLTFDSPFDMLPDPVRQVHARWITSDPEPERIVIIHSGWNDEDYTTRARFARDLLDHDIASILPLHPYYGDRRETAGDDSPCPVVSDFGLMGRGGVLEGRSLAKWFHDAGYSVGVAGYSMGGNIAGFVGTLIDFPVAIGVIAASYAAGPAFLDGLLRHTLPWDSLGGRSDAVEERLSAVLHAGSLLDHEPPDHTAAATILAGTRDGFVPTFATQAIHRHWPGSEMDWVNAGHASLLFRKRDRIVGAIARSFERMDEHIAASLPD